MHLPFCVMVLALQNRYKGSTAPFQRSLVVDGESIRAIGDFPCLGQFIEFLLRDAVLAQYMLSSCVCPLHSSIVPEWLNVRSCKQNHAAHVSDDKLSTSMSSSVVFNS